MPNKRKAAAVVDDETGASQGPPAKRVRLQAEAEATSPPRGGCASDSGSDGCCAQAATASTAVDLSSRDPPGFKAPEHVPLSSGRSYLQLGVASVCSEHGLPRCAACDKREPKVKMATCCARHHATPEQRAAIRAARESQVRVCQKHNMTQCSQCPSLKKCCQVHHACASHGRDACELCKNLPRPFRERTPGLCCRRGHHNRGFDPAAAAAEAEAKASGKKKLQEKDTEKKPSPRRQRLESARRRSSPVNKPAVVKREPGAFKLEPATVKTELGVEEEPEVDAEARAGRGGIHSGPEEAHSRPTGPYKCEACGARVGDPGDDSGSDADQFWISKPAVCRCKKQKRTASTHKQKIWRCPHEGCDKMFTLRRNMRRHALTHEAKKADDGDGTRHQCPHCDRSYASKQGLTDHIRYKHKEGTKTYKCEAGCGFEVIQRGKLRLHYKSAPYCNERVKANHKAARQAAELRKQQRAATSALTGQLYSEVDMPTTPDLPAIDATIHRVPNFSFALVECPNAGCDWWAAASFSLPHHLEECKAQEGGVRMGQGGMRFPNAAKLELPGGLARDVTAAAAAAHLRAKRVTSYDSPFQTPQLGSARVRIPTEKASTPPVPVLSEAEDDDNDDEDEDPQAARRRLLKKQRHTLFDLVGADSA